MTASADDADRALASGAWRGGSVWEFAERLAAVLDLDDDIEVWQWPEDAEPPHAPPDYLWSWDYPAGF